MSTVLWANVLTPGGVVSEQADRHALYTHTRKLDALCKSLGLPSFAALCDTTDARFNTGDAELPDGMTSTDQLMARDGVWAGLAEAIRMLRGLLDHIRAEKVRFGLFSNAHDDVVAELEEVLAFAESHAGRADKFNLAVVM